MSEIKRILFPTDFSETADAAKGHAVEWAKRFKAGVTALHVRTVYTDDPTRIREELEESALEDPLHEKMGELGGEVRVETRVVRNVSQAAGILDFLAENPIDLVVMGTHGRTGLSHFLLGSVAEKILRHAPCPVLTVGHVQADYRSSPAYRNILVGFDFSRHSLDAVRHASELARRFESQVHALYVLEREIHPAYYDYWAQNMKKDLPDIENEARKSLADVLSGEGLDSIHLHVVAGGGLPHREISDFARKNEMDLIVMGTHGLSGLEHMLLGSVTERVVRTASCPVLTFKLGQPQA